MDATLTSPDAVVRPWRTATIVASLIAAVELVALLGLGFKLLARPLSHRIASHAAADVAKTPQRHPLRVTKVRVSLPRLTRGETSVMVLNGNGRSGAAHAEASSLQSFGYRVPTAGNAPRSDYATSVVMYRPGYSGDANRLAHDVGIKVVGPLDGLRPSQLHGSQLVVIVGAG